MAIPKGKRTSAPKTSQPQPNIPQVELVCKITGITFMGYKDQLPISMEGWSKLTEEQKFMINKGTPLSVVIGGTK